MSTPKSFQDRAPAGRPVRRARGSRLRWVLFASVAAAVVVAVLFVTLRKYLRPPATLVEALAREDSPRPFAPRLSIQRDFRPCPTTRSRGPIPSAECAVRKRATASRRLRRLRSRIQSAADSGTADGIHADALLDLAWGNPGKNELSRVIEQLNGLAASDDASADVLADLSAALLIRAGREHTIDDVYHAVNVAELALKRDPHNPAALHNRALALEAVRLDSAATDAWSASIAADPGGEWVEEARRHLQALRWIPGEKPGLGASDSVLIQLATTSPQDARNLGWDKLLRAWGEAVLRADAAAADAALHRADLLGRTLEARGCDATLADAVRAIQAHARDTVVTRRLAEGHRLYAQGHIAVIRLEYQSADSIFSLLERMNVPSPALNAWMAVNLAPQRRAADQDAAVRLIHDALSWADTLRHPALAGRALWTLGVIQAKDNKFDIASGSYESALRLLKRSGEQESTGALLSVYAEAEWVEKNSAEAYSKMLEALVLLRKYRDTQSLHTALANLSRWIADDGYPSAALRVNDEDVAVARHTGIPVLVVEARDNRADGLARLDETEAALAEVAATEPLLDSLDVPAREYFSALLGATRGLIGVKRTPREAEAQLTVALRFLHAPKAGVPLRLVSVLLARADARIALGLTDSARADTERALVLIEEAARGPDSSRPDREMTHSVRETVHGVVAGLVAEGRSRQALELLELGSASLGQPTLGALASPAPAGRVVLRYAVVGDSVLTWALSARGLDFAATAVPAREIERQVAAARRALQQRDDSTAREELQRLHGVLIRPIAESLADSGTEVVVVPDGVLAGVPFSALRNPVTRRYLIQDHLIRRGVAQAAVGASAAASGFRTAAVVVDPDFDPRVYRDLGRLPGAQQESAYVASWLGTPPYTVSGARATADTLRRLLPRVRVLHFAGHAISDEDYPDSSFLVLARGGTGSSRLTAAEIAAMRLGRLDLVILSACRTLNDSRGGAGGFTGLGGAFLAAGARGVIGSLWEVNDARTSALMQRFYAFYRTTPDAAVALHRAQLDLLKNGTAAERSPSAWAGFEYAGR